MSADSGPLGGEGRSQVKPFQRGPLGELWHSAHTSQANMYNLFISLLCDPSEDISCSPSNTVYPVCFATKWRKIFSVCVCICLSGSRKTPWYLKCYSLNPVKSQRSVSSPAIIAGCSNCCKCFAPPAVLNERCVSLYQQIELNSLWEGR